MSDSSNPALAGTETLSADELLTAIHYEVLANERRRHVLDCLANREASMTVVDLAEAVARRERDAGRDDVSADERKRIHVTLYHAHLPMMANAGIVEYDRSRGTVRLASDAGPLIRVRSRIHA